jgi:hypothetical protein
VAHGGQGRPVSWVAVLVITAGFIIGGVGLCLSPTWWMFYTGLGIAAAGGIFALAVGIMEDYSTEGH